MTISHGSRLGPYEVLAQLGAGGMGEVYRAKDTRLERTVAIKVLPQRLSSSAEVRQRFEREAKTISQLSHPHICALYDVGREGETEYLVMEYLEGETLFERLAKGPLAFDQVLRYGLEIADALDKAHRQGIVHRDLKPGNVMLTKSGVKLLDFGLAKAVAPAAARSGASLTTLPTQTGRDHSRDLPVHGARAARRPRRGRAHRHLRVRRGALRNGHRPEGVLRPQPGFADLLDHDLGARARLHRRRDGAAGVRPRGPDLPRERSRRPLADRARHRGAAAVDRRGRVGGRPRAVHRGEARASRPHPAVDRRGPRDRGRHRAPRARLAAIVRSRSGDTL